MQEEGAEATLLALLVSSIFELGDLERVFLDPTVCDGIGLLVDGYGKQLVLPIEKRPIDEGKAGDIQADQ